MKLWHTIRELYLTWRTGKTTEWRAWEAWYEITVNYRAGDITDMFKNFAHVIEVDPDKFFNPHEPFEWVPCERAKQYFWPARTLGDNCVWRYERVSWNQWDRRWHLDEISGEDRVFVATNSESEAVQIALRWS